METTLSKLPECTSWVVSIVPKAAIQQVELAMARESSKNSWICAIGTHSAAYLAGRIIAAFGKAMDDNWMLVT